MALIIGFGDKKEITLTHAEKLVREYIFNIKPKMNPKAKFPLKETTAKEIYDNLHAQTFEVTGEVGIYQDYIIKGGIVDFLGINLEEYGMKNIRVEDINNDGRFELIYIFCTGSGILTYIEGIYYGPNNIQEKVVKTVP
jgi:hypothetical protein